MSAVTPPYAKGASPLVANIASTVHLIRQKWYRRRSEPGLELPSTSRGRQPIQEEGSVRELYGATGSRRKSASFYPLSVLKSSGRPHEMRIPIREQLGLLVLFTSLMGLAILAITTWVNNYNFVVDIR